MKMIGLVRTKPTLYSPLGHEYEMEFDCDGPLEGFDEKLLPPEVECVEILRVLP